jgi:prepilin-type N-terminal cleavage/methylation domain-containing protein
MKNFGFTLAEILITLAIVGIVAVLTIPTVCANIRAKKLQSQFNKAYTDLNQAVRIFYQDNDMSLKEYMDTKYYLIGDSSTNALKKFMAYFKGYRDSGYLVSTYYNNLGITNYSLNGDVSTSYPCDHSHVFQDLSGRIFTLDDAIAPEITEYNLKICVDINGNSKPNKWGLDRFVFVFTDTNSIVPYTGASASRPSVQETDENIIKKYCSSKIANYMHTCAYYALRNISPEGNGDYWHDFLKGK